MSRFHTKRTNDDAIDDHKNIKSDDGVNHHHQHNSQNQHKKRSRLESDIPGDATNSPKIKFLCQVIADTHSTEVESILEEAGLKISQKDVEDVLKLSYSSPASSVKFFRWAGRHINHSPYSWNLVVDMLGKNSLFDAMWDCIRSMQKENALSLATFASVFSSYFSADREPEALMTFDVMEQYGCPRDIAALNSLISAACREAKTAKAVEYLKISREKVNPDVDTYAILLEGWENERNPDGAKEIFSQMVDVIGWDRGNCPAYDSYLIALLSGADGVMDAVKALEVIHRMGCMPSKRFFKTAMEVCAAAGHVRGGLMVWEDMVRSGVCTPDAGMHNNMLELHCRAGDMEVALATMDEMVSSGVFPDCNSYDLLLKYSMKLKEASYASLAFNEMIKNEFVPSHENCTEGILFFMNIGKSDMAIRVWKCMVKNYKSKVDEIGNILIISLRDGNRLPEAVKYAAEMSEIGVKVSSATLTKLKHSLTKEGKATVYEELLKKWKGHSSVL